jgi:hypothetical protein
VNGHHLHLKSASAANPCMRFAICIHIGNGMSSRGCAHALCTLHRIPSSPPTVSHVAKQELHMFMLVRAFIALHNCPGRGGEKNVCRGEREG